MQDQSDLPQGTLDLLILRTLGLGPQHGLGIARRIEQITHGAFQVKPGSLFPALYRLEERGLVVAEWGNSETQRKAKCKTLTTGPRTTPSTGPARSPRTPPALVRPHRANDS